MCFFFITKKELKVTINSINIHQKFAFLGGNAILSPEVFMEAFFPPDWTDVIKVNNGYKLHCLDARTIITKSLKNFMVGKNYQDLYCLTWIKISFSNILFRFLLLSVCNPNQRYFMFLWGLVLLELASHHYHNKGSDQGTLQLS